MMHVAAYGRLGSDPKPINTKTGTPMAVANIAVELRDRQDEAHTQWVGIVTFGRVAETLLRHSKGDLLSVSGKTQYNAFTDAQGQVREQLQVVADSVVSARSVRPGGGKRQSTCRREHQADFDDEMPL